MRPLEQHQPSFRWIVLFGGCAIMAVWFAVFPGNPPFDLEDVFFEGVLLTAVIVAYLFSTRLSNPILEAGFGIFTIAFLMDFLDEFTKEPGIVNTQLEGLLKLAALALIVAGLHVAYRDFNENLSSARRREEALVKSEEKYKNLIEHIVEVVCEIDTSKTITYISPQVSALLAYAPQDLAGRQLASLSASESREEFSQTLSDIMARGEATPLFEHTLLRSDGEPVTVQSSGTPIRANGTLNGYRLVSRDISEQKRAEEALRQANVKLHLLSDITRHDVLNQLTIILGLNEIVRDQITDPELLALIKKEHRAAENVHELIDFTKDYQDIGIKSPAWQNIATIAQRSIRNLDLDGMSTQIRLDGLEVYADPLLEKVFLTLFENTLRHGGAVRTITLASGENPAGLTIVYEDDGIGIPENEKNLIFRREYGKNTGYGLFLAREILSITGIAIQETGRYGEGSRFELLVPKGTYRSDQSGTSIL